MSSETQTVVIKDWADLWSMSGAVKRFVSLFTDDCVYEDVALGHVIKGKSEIARFYQQTRSAFPDFKVTLESHRIAEDQAVAQWLTTGTQLGDIPGIGELHGIPATRKQVSFRGASIFALQNGKIDRCQDYYNLGAMLQQLAL